MNLTSVPSFAVPAVDAAALNRLGGKSGAVVGSAPDENAVGGLFGCLNAEEERLV